MADVSLRNLGKRFGNTVAVEGLSLDIADGELVVLLGPTGAGKTTTLRLVAGLEHADRGQVCGRVPQGRGVRVGRPADCRQEGREYAVPGVHRYVGRLQLLEINRLMLLGVNQPRD